MMDNTCNVPEYEDLISNDMPGYIRIRFGDYFEVRQPRYTSLSQLDRQHCYYLADAWDKLCRYINNPAMDHIPFEVLESLRVWDIGRYHTLINVYGEVVDLSIHSKWYSGRWQGVVPNDDLGLLVEKWSCRLSAMNNVMLNDQLDIEATVIYNLYEIKPLTDLISVDFLRYYFWCDGSLDKQRREFEEKGEAPSLGALFLLWTEQRISDELEEETGGLVRSMLDVDVLKDEEADLESFEQHEEIINTFNKMLEEDARKYGKLYLKAAFGTPDYEQLRRFEMQVHHKIQVENDSATDAQNRINESMYTGFVAELEHFEAGFQNIKTSGIRKVYNLPLKVVEVILRAKLWYRLGSKVIWDRTMMGDMIDILWDHWEKLCRSRCSFQQKKELINAISSIAGKRNTWAHGSKEYSIDEAEEIMQRVYRVIKEINRLI